MTPEHWIGLGIFALGLALNAGVIWKGLSIVEKSVEELQEENEELTRTVNRQEGDISNLRRDLDRIERKLYGPR